MGASSATTILSNADVIVAYRTNHWDTLTELSRKCGEREVDYGAHTSREALITQSQLGAMQTGQALVMVSGRLKFVTWLPDYSELYSRADYRPPVRTAREHTPPAEAVSVAKIIKELKAGKAALEETDGEEETEDEPDEHIPFFDMHLAGMSYPKDGQSSSKPSPFHMISDAGVTELCVEERKMRPKKAGKKKGGYDLMILRDGGNRRAVMDALVASGEATRTQALMHLTFLPAILHLSSKRAAEKLKKKIEAAGGTADVAPSQDDDDTDLPE